MLLLQRKPELGHTKPSPAARGLGIAGVVECCVQLQLDQCYDNSKHSLVIMSMLVLCLKGAKSFLEVTECTLRTQQCVHGKKYGLRDVKIADFIQYWQRSRLKNQDKPTIFMKKNVRNYSFCTTSFIWFWRRPGLTKVYCMFLTHADNLRKKAH